MSVLAGQRPCTVRPFRSSRPGPGRGPLLRLAVLANLATVVVLGIALLLGRRAGVWLATLTRDPTQAAGVPFYYGLLSNLGVVLWAACAAIALFAATRLPPGRDRSRLGGLGAVTAVLVLDDLLMIHDEVMPVYLGIPEEAVEVVYLLLLATWALRFAPDLLRPPLLLLVLALGCFGVSVLVEYLPRSVLTTHLVEDGAKLLGVANWSAYLLWSVHEVLPGPDGPGP